MFHVKQFKAVNKMITIYDYLIVMRKDCLGIYACNDVCINMYIIAKRMLLRGEM